MSMFESVKNKILSTSIAVAEFKNNEAGVTAVEYAILVASVSAILLVIFNKDAGPVKQMLDTIFSTTKSNVINSMS